jgi:tRNA-dihydrouridine synthase
MPLMLGRGLIANPALVRQLQGGPSPSKAELEAFHGELFEATASRLGSPRSTMFRMKELWSYLILMFDRRERYQKALRKTTSLTEYGAMVAHIFRELPLREDAEVNW